jgi:hypothetical protein
MRVNDLGSPKKLFAVCLVLFVLMVYFGQNKDVQPEILKGTVANVQEQDGVTRALAVDSQGERFVVRFTPQYLLHTTPPAFQEGQEVEIKVTNFKGVKQGVTCEFLELIKAGAVKEPSPGSASAPKGNEPLPVDDLKGPLGYKGM